MSPRARSLEGTLLAWSPGTGGRPVTAPVLTLPTLLRPSDLTTFLASARGRYVLLSAGEPSCRPPESWERWGRAGASDQAQGERARVYRDWAARLDRLIRPAVSGSATSPLSVLLPALEDAGVAGLLTSRWAEAWGTQQVHDSWSAVVPTLDLSCEDYGLVFRLAESGQGPALRVEAEAETLGEVPVWNTIGVIPGRELPEEYVVLSAHFDSWDSASGATDNGTGTLTMMEAMRILKAAYPSPKRTIIVGHWNGEEQGLNGSRAFARTTTPRFCAECRPSSIRTKAPGASRASACKGFRAPVPSFVGGCPRCPRI